MVPGGEGSSSAEAGSHGSFTNPVLTTRSVSYSLLCKGGEGVGVRRVVLSSSEVFCSSVCVVLFVSIKASVVCCFRKAVIVLLVCGTGNRRLCQLFLDGNL